jgi:hypothetical protein
MLEKGVLIFTLLTSDNYGAYGDLQHHEDINKLWLLRFVNFRYL